MKSGDITHILDDATGLGDDIWSTFPKYLADLRKAKFTPDVMFTPTLGEARPTTLRLGAACAGYLSESIALVTCLIRARFWFGTFVLGFGFEGSGERSR